MGACASVPKAMKGEAAAPEPPKEETPTTAVEETTVEAKPEEAAEKKPEGGQDEKKAEEDGDNTQSLGTLLVEGEAPKGESSSEPKKAESEESKAEVLPVSEPAQSEEKAADTTPPLPAEAAATTEKGKEVAEQK